MEDDVDDVLFTRDDIRPLGMSRSDDSIRELSSTHFRGFNVYRFSIQRGDGEDE